MFSIREWQDDTSFGAPIIKYTLVDRGERIKAILFDKDFANHVCDLLNNAQQSVHWTARLVSKIRGLAYRLRVLTRRQ